MSDPAFALLLGSVRAVSARLVVPQIGAWFLDLDLDPDSSPVTSADIPTGSQTLTITPADGSPAITLAGTVDDAASGRFVSSVRVRLLAGGGGWGKVLERQSWNSAGGVSALTVEQATAGEVGETVNDPQPLSLGVDWVRFAGPASLVFQDRAWFVDLAGVTQVGSWPSADPPPSLELLQWDPLMQRGIVSADGIVLPGMTLTDARFDGPVTIRDVEQTWDAKGTRAIMWCSATAVTRMISAITNMVRTFGKLSALKIYAYRIVTQDGANLNLQAIQNPDGTDPEAPDLIETVIWPGIPGFSGKHAVGSSVLVAFIAQPQGALAPFVFSFDPTVLPIEATIDAFNELHLGPTAASVAVAGGGPGIARQQDSVLVYFPPLMPLSGTVGGIPFVGILTVPGPGIGTIQTSSNKANCGFVEKELLLALGALALVALIFWTIVRWAR